MWKPPLTEKLCDRRGLKIQFFVNFIYKCSLFIALTFHIQIEIPTEIIPKTNQFNDGSFFSL